MSAPRRPAPSWRSRGGAVVATLVFVVLAGLLVAALASVLQGLDGAGGRQRGDGLTPADVSRDTPVAQGLPLDPAVDVVTWADGVADRTGVPARALAAYASAEIAQRAQTPDCRLSWSTLAGIGRVESDHGRINGTEIDADGVARPSIVGIALDGSRGTRETLDTDGGRLDDDLAYDRAVGPMQFLPATWARFGADGDGDGDRDPQQIDDAALAAAAYLCADDRDTASGEGWWDGVLAYNRSGGYARLVWAAADRYATASRATT